MEAAAREIYDEWAACQHFFMYDEVPDVLRQLRGVGLRIGLISNTHRCLASFQSHFELEGLFDGNVVLLRARLHEAASEHLRGGAADSWTSYRDEAMMVGDSLLHDSRGRAPAGHAGGARVALRPRPGLSSRRADYPVAPRAAGSVVNALSCCCIRP